MRLAIDPDITRARTLDPAFYASEAAYAAAREHVFARTWQWIGDLADVAQPHTLSPRTLLPGLLDEPLLLARDGEGALRCLSNVCTHRANLLVDAPCRAREIRCRYHSRRFDLAGRMTFMPEFTSVQDFPSPGEDLPHVPLAQWMGHAFASLAPASPCDAFVGDVATRMPWLDAAGFRHDPSRDRDYEIDCHWAIYVENYLEGFHVPFVHAGLNAVIDHATYSTELFRFASLQCAHAAPGEAAFGSPAGVGRAPVAAYYWFVFPNLMLNFYPWGLSLNLVEPQSIATTRVRFRSYVGDATKLGAGAGAELDRVEAEDEAIVTAVQAGVRSRLYRGGRYSPAKERGVHHFHRLLAEFMAPGI